MTILKEFFNFLFDPRLFFAMCVGTLILLIWKREFFSSKAFGWTSMVLLTLFMIFGMFDKNFVLIMTKPDNVPIIGLIFLRASITAT